MATRPTGPHPPDARPTGPHPPDARPTGLHPPDADARGAYYDDNDGMRMSDGRSGSSNGGGVSSGQSITKRGKERMEEVQRHRQEYERNSSPEYQRSLLIPEKDQAVIADYMAVLNHQGTVGAALKTHPNNTL